MPGLFDNSGGGGGILSGALGAFGAGSSPAAQELQLRQQEFGWKVQQFQQAYQAMKQAGISDDRIFSILGDPNGPAAQKQYGYAPGAVSGGGGTSVPAWMVPQQPGGGGGIQTQPSQQPQPQQPQGPAAAIRSIVSPLQDIGSEGEAKTTTAKLQATGLPQFINAKSQAENVVGKLQALRDDPGLPDVLGQTYGRIGSSNPLAAGQRAGLISSIEALQGGLLENTYTGLRTAAGKPPSPGAIKELTLGKDLMATRVQTPEDYKKTLNDVIDQVKRETNASFEAIGKPKDHQPQWPQAQAQQPQQQNDAPGVGTIVRGYKFLGGPPHDPKSWAKVQ